MNATELIKELQRQAWWQANKVEITAKRRLALEAAGLAPIPDPVKVVDPATGVVSWYGEQAPRLYRGWREHRAWLAYHTGSASTPVREGYELDKLPYDIEANALAH